MADVDPVEVGRRRLTRAHASLTADGFGYMTDEVTQNRGDGVMRPCRALTSGEAMAMTRAWAAAYGNEHFDSNDEEFVANTVVMLQRPRPKGVRSDG